MTDLVGKQASFIRNDPPSHYVIDRVGQIGALVFEPASTNTPPNTKTLLIRPDILERMVAAGVVTLQEEAT